MSQPTIRVEFEGKAKVGEVIGNLANLQLRAEDFSSPIALQMAISRIYTEMMRMAEQRPQARYVGEVRFSDSLGNQVVVGVDLGDKTPPLSNKEVKARVIVETYDED